MVEEDGPSQSSVSRRSPVSCRQLRCYGHDSEAEVARKKLQELLPHLTIEQLRESLPYFRDVETLERYLEGLRTAGLPEAKG